MKQEEIVLLLVYFFVVDQFNLNFLEQSSDKELITNPEFIVMKDQPMQSF